MRYFKILLILIVSPAVQVLGQYQIDRFVINAGTGISGGGQYKIIASIGQPHVSNSSGSDYDIFAGFWQGESECLVNLNQYTSFAQEWLHYRHSVASRPK